jgi:hypothetical protein
MMHGEDMGYADVHVWRYDVRKPVVRHGIARTESSNSLYHHNAQHEMARPATGLTSLFHGLVVQ